MASCVIRTAVADDIGVLGEIRRRASLSNDGDRDVLLAHPEVLEFGGDGIDEGRTRVAVVDGHIAGFTTTADIGDVVDLEDMFVDPPWMRRGIGLELMRDVVARARARGARYVEVTANPHALAFYEQAGFVAGLRPDVETEFARAARLVIDLQKFDGSSREKFSKK